LAKGISVGNDGKGESVTIQLISKPIFSGRRIAFPTGLFVIAVGCLVLAGWMFDITLFKSVLPGFVSMNPVTAVAFILSGAALLILLVPEADRRFRFLGQVCGLVVALLGLLRLCEYLFGWNLGIDFLLFREQVMAVSPPSQMPVTTALNFLMLGLAFIIYDIGTGRSRQLSELLILLPAFFSLAGFIGYIYGIKYFYNFSMALHTALTFIVFCSGFLCSRSDYGLMKLILGDGLGGIVARRLFPAAIVLPVLLDWLQLEGQRAGWHSLETGSAIFTTLRILILVGFILWISASVELIDIERRSNEKKLRESQQEISKQTQILKSVLSSIGEGVIVADLDGKFLIWNSASERIMNMGPAAISPGEWSDRYGLYRPDQVTLYPIEQLPLSRAIRGDSVDAEEMFLRNAKTPKGSWLNVSGSPLRDESGTLLGGVIVFIDITDRKRAENEVRQTNTKLTALVEELEVHKQEMTLLSEMGELLQTCGTLQEASSVIAKSLRQLFLTESGALYLLMASRNLVERTAVWGATPPEERLFPPDECWALRRGQVHSVEDVGTGLVCKHVQQPRSGGYLCIPMQAQNDVLGVLQLTLLKSNGPEGIDEAKDHLKITKQKLAVAVAEQIALALSNIKLRETLRSQAIRDSLTGLFNRRYLEETLAQEVSRAERSRQRIGVIMIDIDHFKQYNDVHGHEAGDVVLSALGQFLKEKIRGGDTACRYGGEEFTVILPGASVEDTLRKAKSLCDGIKQIKPLYRGQPLEGITLSLGVSGFPDHGSVGEAILRAADQALYQAKAAGRDQAVSAGLQTRPLGNIV
jgi:diguanylate cyclase (GGDEF)-like protein